jgi:hypothetical protein
MEQNLNDKSFIKFAKEKITKSIQELFLIEEQNADFDLKINELKTFFLSLIKDKYISNTNKIAFYFIFIEACQDCVKNWLVEFLTQIIIKLNKTHNNNIDSIINDQYFLFKFLSNKENIKNLTLISLKLTDINFLVVRDIYFFPESKTIFNDQRSKVSNVVLEIKEEIKEIFEIEDNYFAKSGGLSLFLNYIQTLKDIVMSYEDKYINIINDQPFFEKNSKGNLSISKPYLVFIKIIFSLYIVNNEFDINNTHENIKKQLKDSFAFLGSF